MDFWADVVVPFGPPCCEIYLGLIKMKTKQNFRLKISHSKAFDWNDALLFYSSIFYNSMPQSV